MLVVPKVFASDLVASLGFQLIRCHEYLFRLTRQSAKINKIRHYVLTILSSGNTLVCRVGSSNLGPVKSDTALPMARHCCDVFSKETVLPVCTDAEMGPVNLLHDSSKYSNYIDWLIWIGTVSISMKIERKSFTACFPITRWSNKYGHNFFCISLILHFVLGHST